MIVKLDIYVFFVFIYSKAISDVCYLTEGCISKEYWRNAREASEKYNIICGVSTGAYTI
jgi:hypothetical protein